MKSTCGYCNGEYKQYRTNQVCCSCSCRQKLYRKNNPERVKEWEKTKQYTHRKEIIKRQKEYLNKNYKKIIQYKDNWYKENRERILKKKQDINALKPKQKYRTPIENRIVNNCRSRISIALRRGIGRKSDKTRTLIGCNFKNLMNHLENQFVDDMSWDNYGMCGWSIDHIKPCNSFDLFKKEERLKCFHYTNLQPLWHADNLIKGDRYEMD